MLLLFLTYLTFISYTVILCISKTDMERFVMSAYILLRISLMSVVVICTNSGIGIRLES